MGDKTRPYNGSTSRREWELKLWAAKEFGWKPEEVDAMPWEDVSQLLREWNRGVQEIERKSRISSMRKTRRII